MLELREKTEKVILRDYQEECVKRTLASYEQNSSGTELLVLPCAAGKTVIFSHVIDALNQRYGLKALIIADRDDLLDQAADKYRMIRPDAHIGKIGSGLHQYGHEVTVASIATISRPEHLIRLPLENYGLIITDEADLSAAPSYQKVYEALPGIFHLMVTATPDRLDGKPILPIGQKPLYEKSIIDMIRQRYLCDVKCIAVKTKVDLSQLHNRAGDYRQEELADAIDSPARNKLIVEKYQEHTPGKRAVAFCVTVEHAKHLADAFNEAGINAEVVSGDTPIPVRKDIYQRFKSGKTLVITNVMVASRGWDEPLCEVGIGARPTQSRALFIQQLGRILRLAPGKQFATWLEVTDNCFNHKLVPQSLRRVLNKHFMKDDETILESEERLKKESAEREAKVHKLETLRDKDLRVNLLETFSWEHRENGMYVLTVGKEQHRIALIPEENDCYSVYARLFPDYEPVKWADPQPLDWAQNAAERKIRVLLADPTEFKKVDPNAAWRGRIEPNSEKQIKMLVWKKIEYMGPLTKVEASDLIEAFFAKKEIADAAAFKRKMDKDEKAAQKKTAFDAWLELEPTISNEELALYNDCSKDHAGNQKREYMKEHSEIKEMIYKTEERKQKRDAIFAALDINPMLSQNELAQLVDCDEKTSHYFRLKYFKKHPELKTLLNQKRQALQNAIFTLLDNNPTLMGKELASLTGCQVDNAIRYKQKYMEMHPTTKKNIASTKQKTIIFDALNENENLTAPQLAELAHCEISHAYKTKKRWLELQAEQGEEPQDDVSA